MLLDIGMIARLAPAARDKLVKLFLALADARPEEVTRIAITLGEQLPDFDEAALRPSRRRPRGRARPTPRWPTSTSARWSSQLTRKAGEAGLRMDPELVMLGKTLLNLDQVAPTLDPDVRAARGAAAPRRPG